MYPANYLSLFPAFPRENKVFVAMSFDSRFERRWETVISPAIRSVAVNNTALEPSRVDLRQISDSVLTEILTGIAHHRLILGDITTIGSIDGKPIRNANVLYEIGLAHASRLPEEVILFRSDNDALLFDVANIRVNGYEPEGNPAAAKERVSDTIIAAIKEIDLKKHLTVKRAAESLDCYSWVALMDAVQQKGIEHPSTTTVQNVLGNMNRITSIRRLLELGALSASYVMTPEILAKSSDMQDEDFVTYKATAFGEAIYHHIGDQMFADPNVQKLAEDIFSSDKKEKDTK